MKSLILVTLALATLFVAPAVAVTDRTEPPEVQWNCSYGDDPKLPKPIRDSMPIFCTVRGWHKESAGMWSSDSTCAIKIYESGIALLFVISNGATFPGSKAHIHNKTSNNGAYLGDVWLSSDTRDLQGIKDDFFVSRCGAQLQALPERVRQELKGFDPTVP